MALVFKCAHCRRRLAVSRHRAGTEMTCPVCGVPVSVPVPETAICLRAAPTPAAPPPETPPAPLPALSETLPPRRIASGASLVNKRVVAVTAGVAVLLLVAVAVGGILLSRAPAQQLVTIVGVSTFATALDTELAAEEPAFVEATPERTAVAAAPEPDMEYQALVVKRRDKLTDEELRKQLIQVPELRMFNPAYEDGSSEPRRPGEVRIRGNELLFQRKLQNLKLHDSVALIEKRPDLVGVPLLKGPDCQLGKEPAEDLQVFSRKLRDLIARSQNQREPDAAAEAIRGGFNNTPHGSIVYSPGSRDRAFGRTVPTMMQMLIPENQAVRQVLVEHLAKLKGPAASVALAKIALFDLSENVRLAALEALRARPHEEYRQVLLDGLRYIWAPVAEHAAEALVVLRDVNAVPRLRELAVAPDPKAPIFDAKVGAYVQKELVRINHLSNCMMCHAPSKSSTDLVRGRVPTPGQPLPPLSQYYESNDGIFVRADVTYLRQDFSIPQPVDDAGAWPSMQRYDYLVRNAPLPLSTDIEKLRLRYSNDYPQREAVLYALKELEDRERAGPSKEDLMTGLERK
jgi:hypothetical protein